jgi:phosphoglycerate dehydrogenase-like enzyme
LAFDPYFGSDQGPVEGVSLVPFAELLNRADQISIHTPLTGDSRLLFSAKTLSSMRPGAVLVNTSRGGIVDESALAQALAEGRLAGAGLDVNEIEPLPRNSPLLGSSKVILTGHSAASSVTANDELRRRAVDAVVRALRGELPAAIANPEVLERPDCRLVRREASEP